MIAFVTENPLYLRIGKALLILSLMSLSTCKTLSGLERGLSANGSGTNLTKVIYNLRFVTTVSMDRFGTGLIVSIFSGLIHFI